MLSVKTEVPRSSFMGGSLQKGLRRKRCVALSSVGANSLSSIVVGPVGYVEGDETLLAATWQVNAYWTGIAFAASHVLGRA